MAFVPFVETDQPTMSAFNEKFQQNYEATIAAAGKVESGSYTGAGAKTKIFSLSFSPDILIIVKGTSGVVPTNSGWDYTSGMILTKNQDNYFVNGNTHTASFFEKSVTLTATSAGAAFNTSGSTYHYFAIGT